MFKMRYMNYLKNVLFRSFLPQLYVVNFSNQVVFTSLKSNREALFYFAFFGVLLGLRKRVPKMYQIGKTSGLFFIGTFVFRFFIEFFKVKQSMLINGVNPIDMGQWLSLPLLIVGLLLFFGDQNRLRACFVKRHER